MLGPCSEPKSATSGWTLNKSTIKANSAENDTTQIDQMPYSVDQHMIKTRDSILRFFFRLYKIQLGADAADQGEMELVPLAPTDHASDRIYNFKVMSGGGLKSRRMSGDGGWNPSTPG